MTFSFSIFKIILAATLISVSSTIAAKNPKLAGFIIALPLSSMIAIALTQIEFKNTETSVAFAKSIFISVPLSLSFFVPFLFANKLQMPFWMLFCSGLMLLGASYFVQKQFFA